jgi:hypothetical protein
MTASTSRAPLAHSRQRRVAAVLQVGVEADEAFGFVGDLFCCHGGGNAVASGKRQRMLADHGGRRLFAAADARSGDDAHFPAEDRGQSVDQRERARHFAGQAVAHAHGQRGGCGLAFLDDVEVVVEGGNLVDLGLGQLHFLGQRRQVRGRQVAEPVLDLVQVLDQQVGLARLFAEQRLDFGQRLRIDAAPLWRLAFSLAGTALHGDGDDWVIH